MGHGSAAMKTNLRVARYANSSDVTVNRNPFVFLRVVSCWNRYKQIDINYE